MKQHSFKDCSIVFATNHGKAAAAEEPFKRLLSASIEPLSIDSDSLGTFSGEIERSGSMIDALRGKIHLARQATSNRFVMASEGSFSTPGGFGFLVQGIEMLMLHDAATGIEIIEQSVTCETNYATATLKSLDQLQRFLAEISCGSHAVVLYPAGVSLYGNVSKGITTWSEAESAFTCKCAASPIQSVVAMSDMRAHVNPTRMRAIQSCCELLASRLNTACPVCSSGGFGLIATVPGLPCEACGSPTSRAIAEKHACPFCNYSNELPRFDGRTTASAAECDWCNP